MVGINIKKMNELQIILWMVFYMDPGHAKIVLKGETITRDKTFEIVWIYTLPEYKDLITQQVIILSVWNFA